MNKEQAWKDVRNAAIAAFLQAGITGVFVIVLMVYPQLQEHEMLGQYFGDPSIFVSIVLYFICGLGLLRYSRVSAVLLLIFWFFDKLYLYLEHDATLNMIEMLFLAVYTLGFRGAYMYHKIRQQEDPASLYRETSGRKYSRWKYYIGVPVGLLVSLVMLYGFLSITGYVPPTEVLAGDKLPESYQVTLRDAGILQPGEDIEFFYSEGFFSIMEGGNILTDRRVISYETLEDELTIFYASYKDVAKVVHVSEGGFVENTVVDVYPFEGDGFRLFLSTENDGDKRFIALLRKKTGL